MVRPAWFTRMQPRIQAARKLFEEVRAFGPRPILWLKDVIGHGDPRVHALCSLIACVAMAISLIILSAAVYMGRSAGVEMTAVAGSLGLFAGAVYVRGKMSEKEDV